VTAPLARLIITSVTFHAAEVGVAYAPVTLGAIGGRAPYTWTANSGTLPTGLTLSSDGKVTGTPSVAGTFSFVVRVDDASGSAAGVARSVTVARHLTASGSCATQVCSVEQGCTTVCGAFGSQSGGVGPFNYVRSAGSLPPSTSLKGLSLAGTFTAASKYFFAVTVTDSLGAAASVSANFSVFPHIRFAVSSFTCNGLLTTGCTAKTTYTGGTPGLALPTLKFTLISTTPAGMTLPPGYSFTARSGTVIASFPAVGCGNQQFDKTWVVSLVLVDKSFCAAATYCSSAPSKVTATLVNSC